LVLDRFGQDQYELLIRQLFHIRQSGAVQEYADRFTGLVDQLIAYGKTTDPLFMQCVLSMGFMMTSVLLFICNDHLLWMLPAFSPCCRRNWWIPGVESLHQNLHLCCRLPPDMIVVAVLLLVALRLMIGGLVASKTSWPRFDLIGVPRPLYSLWRKMVA